jgi:Leucine-rich repeat (LRR) protein
MDMFDVISNIASLRELRLAENELQGELSAGVCSLTSLEVLDLQGNKLTSLPNEIQHLASLRTLNVASNQLTGVPMELFETALIELIADKNRFEGTFFAIESAPNLQELNISNNSLKSLCEGENIKLPALKTLNVSTNRLVSLPSVESWTNLQTLILAENKVTTFPEGFTTLSQLRTADFTANDISQIDDRIALMSLEHLTLAANPLRERKFLTMGFEDIKRDLAARLPADLVGADEDEVEAMTETVVEDVHGWQVTPSGTLDLSSKSLAELDEDAVLACADDIRHFNLQQNVFESIPLPVSQITFLTVLDLSKNNIATALTSLLSLPKLKDLRLNTNKLTSIEPLIVHLSAPSLQTLDVSNNRLLGTLPTLRTTYPQLNSLIASDNRISEVPASSLDGLKIVNLANNDIERLEPQIGLLQGTLTSLNVEGNKFRVPSYHVLQKGTEAVLGWLRDRIPRESWKSDGTVFFDADDGAETF